MSTRQTLDALSHNQQASQLRDQLRGLLPDSIKPAAKAVVNEAGDGMQKLLGYVELAAEYWEPIVAVLQRLRRRVPAATAPVMAAAAAPARRRFGVHPLAAVGIAVGLGLAVYGVTRVVQDFKRDA